MSAAPADDRQRIPKELRELLESVAAEQELEEYLAVAPGVRGGRGDNYSSDIVKVKVVGRRRGQLVELPLVVKCMPPTQHELTQARRTNYFDTELAVYGEVLPLMRKFHEERILGGETRKEESNEMFVGVADFFGGFHESGKAALALRDMAADGYRLADRREGLDPAHCRLVVRELARLHALSLALRDQRPDDFERLADKVRHEVFVRASLADYLRGTAAHAERALLKTLPEDSACVRKFREAVPDLARNLVALVGRDVAEPYAVIGHGDCWANNYLFKYDVDGETPLATCLVDLQICRCGSPLLDLSYFLFTSASCGTTKRSYEQLTSEYYDTLSEYLRRLGSDPDRLFPTSAFKDHERRFSRFGLCMALMYLHVFVADPGVSFDFERMFAHPEDAVHLLNPQYEQRITDIVVDMVDRGFI